jgi:hypothetical protein
MGLVRGREVVTCKFDCIRSCERRHSVDSTILEVLHRRWFNKRYIPWRHNGPSKRRQIPNDTASHARRIKEKNVYTCHLAQVERILLTSCQCKEQLVVANKRHCLETVISAAAAVTTRLLLAAHSIKILHTPFSLSVKLYFKGGFLGFALLKKYVTGKRKV